MESLIGFLAPPVCLGCGQEGSGLCEACSAAEIVPHGERCWRCGALSPACRTCQKCQSFGGPRYVWITTDYAGLAAKMLQAYKFAGQRFMSRALAGAMAETFLAFNSQGQLAKSNYLLTYVPTATSRVRHRGFDHSALLAAEFSKLAGIRVHKLLRRHGQASQVGARRLERLKQAGLNYSTPSSATIEGRNILLLDDVLTTGATLRAATKALRQAGAKHVDALVFAKRL